MHSNSTGGSVVLSPGFKSTVFTAILSTLCVPSLSCPVWAQDREATIAASRELAAIDPEHPYDSIKPEQHNGDYLNDVKTAELEGNKNGVNQEIFNKEISDEMKQKFNSFNTGYEARELYHLNSRAQYRQYEQANKDLAEWTLKKLLQYHLENTLVKKVEESAKRAANAPVPAKDKGKGGETRAAAKTVMAISSVQKALRNTQFNLGANTKTRIRYDFPNGTVKAGITSPICDASPDYRIRPTSSTPAVGQINQPEKLSLNVSRNFEFIKASSSFSYAMVSETMSYGVNKNISGALSAQFNKTNNMRDNSKDETLFRLNFGTSF
jgi:hypothetical protein